MDAELEFAIQPNTTGKQLFDQVGLCARGFPVRQPVLQPLKAFAKHIYDLLSRWLLSVEETLPASAGGPRPVQTSGVALRAAPSRGVGASSSQSTTASLPRGSPPSPGPPAVSCHLVCRPGSCGGRAPPVGLSGRGGPGPAPLPALSAAAASMCPLGCLGWRPTPSLLLGHGAQPRACLCLPTSRRGDPQSASEDSAPHEGCADGSVRQFQALGGTRPPFLGSGAKGPG